MNKEIYVVFGEAGEYSDYRFWNVGAYEVKEQAENLAQLANKWSEELYELWNSDERSSWYDLPKDRKRSPYDNRIHEHEFPQYNVETLPIHWRIPSVHENS